MNPADDASAPNSNNLTSDATTGVKAPEGMDLSAINEAIAATANDGNNIQNTFDVNDISLENTPTTDAELQAQQAQDPTLNLANSESTANATADLTPAEAPKPAAPAATFIDGDLVDEPAPAVETPASSVETTAPATETPASATETPASTVEASESAKDETATAETAEVATPQPVDTTNAITSINKAKVKKEQKEKEREEKIKSGKGPKQFHLDFDKILHSNGTIIGIVVGVVVLVLGVLILSILVG